MSDKVVGPNSESDMYYHHMKHHILTYLDKAVLRHINGYFATAIRPFRPLPTRTI